MLGGLRVHVMGRVVERFQTQKTGALLAYLALNPSTSHAREHLAELLWPEGDPTAIRNRLNQAVSSLRRQLHPPESATLVLQADHRTIGLNREAIETDAEEFLRSLRAAERAKERNDKIRFLRRAVGLYRGELLNGYYEEWVLADRLHYSDLHSQALRDLVREYSRMGEPDEAIEFAMRLLALEPGDVRVHCELMELYLRADRPKSAIRQYEELERVLDQDGEPVPADAAALRKRAEKELRNAVHTALPRAAAKPAPSSDVATGGIRSNLPRPLSRFFGREVEMQRIADAIDNCARLVTLIGLGGVGKSRLGIETANRLRDRFEGGALFVSIADDSVTTAEAFARAMGLEAGGANAQEAVTAALAGSGAVIALVDTAIDLTDRARMDLEAILESAPDLAVIATARQPIGIAGEIQLPLGPLPTPAEDADLDVAASNPSVSLFVSRAQSVRPDFQLTERTAEPILRLCRRLEGLPLALELAAGWARAMTPTQMLEQATERFQLLESRRNDIAARHRSMRAALDGSFALLTHEEQDAFVRFSFFVGPFSTGDAQSLAPGAAAAEVLDHLVSMSFLTVDYGKAGTRYRMLDTLRAYATEKVSRDMAATVGWLHAQHFLDLTERHHASISDYDADIWAAMNWAHRSGHPETALRLAIALTNHWEYRGRALEGIEWFETLMRETIELDEELVARAEAAYGRLLWIAGKYAAAADALRSALPILATTQHPIETRDTRFALALELHRTGDFEGAEQLLHENLELGQQRGDAAATSRAYRALGNTYVERGDLDAAQSAYEAGLQEARRGDVRPQIAAALANLGNLAILRKEFVAARKWLEQAAEIQSELSLQWPFAISQVLLSRIDLLEGNARGSRDRLVLALKQAPFEDLVVWRAFVQGAITHVEAGRDESGATLAGFAQALLDRDVSGMHRVELAPFEAAIATLKDRLGEDRFRELAQVGRLMARREAEATLADL